ncbi:MAG TPA: porin family protein [Candidatus Kapabacteria bacterium]|nr:porin family protein [Candidatus Kapabacteria bacterium]
MKKLLVFFFLGFLAVPTIAVAQQMMIGARGGVNLANEHYDNLPDGESISGRMLPLVGGQLDYHVGDSWVLSIQLLYDQKGAEANMKSFSYGYNGSEGIADWSISYIELPILAKVSFGSSAVRPYFFAGPSIGYLLSNTETVQAGGGTYIPNGIGINYRIDTTVSITDYTNKIDLSLVAGAGVSWELPHGAEFFLDASYAYGLTNSDHYSWDNDEGIYVYSRDIRIAAGVLFPIH